MCETQSIKDQIECARTTPSSLIWNLLKNPNPPLEVQIIATLNTAAGILNFPNPPVEIQMIWVKMFKYNDPRSVSYKIFGPIKNIFNYIKTPDQKAIDYYNHH